MRLNNKSILLILILNLYSYNINFFNKKNIKKHPYLSSIIGSATLITVVLAVDLFFEKYTKYNSLLFNKAFFKKLEFTEENLKNIVGTNYFNAYDINVHLYDIEGIYSTKNIEFIKVEKKNYFLINIEKEKAESDNEKLETISNYQIMSKTESSKYKNFNILILNKKTNKYETQNKIANFFIKKFFNIDESNNLTQKKFKFDEGSKYIEIEENNYQ
jgi:hypothetical protein